MLSYPSSSLALSALILSLVVVGCGGSTADPPSGTTPAATTAASATPPPAAPTSPATTTTPPNVPPGTPPSTPPSPPSNPPVPPGTCNMLVNGAAVVTAKQVASDAPAPLGGAVANGTYHLVDLTVYTGAAGAAGPLPLSVKQTIAIHGATADAISEVSGKSVAVSSTFVVAGTSASLAQTCPSSANPAEAATFTASATSFVLFLVNGAGQTAGYTYVQ
jgi:hypothetical protein